MTRPALLALAALLAGCPLATGHDPPAPCADAAAHADAPADAGPWDLACWAGDDGVHCFAGPDARAACESDPERPASADCE